MLTDEIEALYIQINRITMGDNLHVLKATTYALGIAAAIKELKSPIGHLLLALSAANIGVSQTESKYGVLPVSLANAAKLLSDGINSKIAEANVNKTTNYFLNGVMNLVFIAALLVPVGFKVEQRGILNFDLLLHALLGCEILEIIYRNILEAAGVNNERMRVNLGQAVTLVTLLIMILPIATSSKKSAEKLIQSLSAQLISLLESAGSNNDLTEEISIAVQQGRMFLSNNRNEEFLNLLLSMEDKFKMKEREKSLKNCIKEIENLSNLIERCVLGVSAEFQKNTAIVQG